MKKINNKLIAIIPARSGSKGIKNKNRINFLGKPLIFWTINSALKSNYLDKIIVSTDDLKILSYRDKFKSKRIQFHKRDKNLSTDKSLIFDTIKIILEKNFNYKEFILLQPDSPLRKTIDINRSICSFYKNSATSCVSVTKTKKPPDLFYKINNKSFIVNKYINDPLPKNKQDYDFFYEINGAIYISKVKDYLKSKSFISKKTLTYEMPKQRSIDIDNQFDLKLAKYFFNY